MAGFLHLWPPHPWLGKIPALALRYACFLAQCRPAGGACIPKIRFTLDLLLPLMLTAQAGHSPVHRQGTLMTPLNEIAIRLQAAAEQVGQPLITGFFGGQHYCAGIEVRTVAEAFVAGAKLGNDFGKVEIDSGYRGTTVLAFREARVSA